MIFNIFLSRITKTQASISLTKKMLIAQKLSSFSFNTMRSLFPFSRLILPVVCSALSMLWLWCCFPINSHAQTQPDMVWEQTNGPEGGYISSFAVSGTSIFAGTWWGRGIFRSTDNGASWVAVNTGLPMGGAIAALLASGGSLFAATGRGISRSDNNGESWVDASTGLTSPIVYSLTAKGNTLFAVTNRGIHRSTNKGASWTVVNTGLTDLSVSALIASDSAVFAGTNSGSIFRSTDDGATWIAVRVPPNRPFGASFFIQSLAVKDNILFAAVPGGILRSTDNGTSWTLFNVNFLATSFAIIGNTLLATTRNGTLFFSTNNGASWTPIHTGLADRVGNIIVSGSTIFAGGLDGILRSTDNGKSWTVANNGLRITTVNALSANGHTLFAGADEGIFRSRDNNGKWTNMNTKAVNISSSLAIIAIDSNTVLAGFKNTVLRSVDSGASWSSTALSGNWTYTGGIRSFLVIGSTVLAATERGRIFRSTDSGMIWNDLNATGLPGANTIAVSGGGAILTRTLSSFARIGNTLFAGFDGYDGGGVFRSLDNGASWTAAGLPNARIFSLCVSGSSTLFAGTNNGGVFRSTDNGASWTAVNIGLTNEDVHSLLMTNNILFVGTRRGGVFRSVNKGRTWTAVNRGLTHPDVRSLAVIDTTLFAGTFAGGVFRATIPPVTPELIANPEEISLGSTPFNGSTTGATFTVIGENLSSPVSITAPSGVLLFNPATETWGQSFSLPINADGSVEQNVAVRLDSSRAGLVGRIGATGSPAFINLMSGTTSAQVGVNGEVLPPPTSLTANPQQISLGNIILNARTTLTTFTVTGVNLPASVSITAPNGALLLNPTTGTWTQTLTLTRSSTGNIEQQISVRLDSSRLGLLGRIGNTGTPAFISVVSDTLSARVQVSGLVREAPQLVALPDSLFFGTLRLGNPPPFTLPTERKYTLVGTNLTDTLIITAPLGTQIFDSVSNSWQSTIRFPITPAPFSANLRTTLTVRIDSTRLGAISSLVQHESGLAQALVRIRGEVLPMPLLQAAPESLAFASIVQGDSVGTREYVLTGSNLPANVVVTAPDGFLLLNPATNTWVRSFTLATSGTGSVMQRIAVRMDSSLVRTFSNAAITHLSGTAAFSTQATVLVSGSVVPLTLPADAETTLELRLLTPRQPLLVRDTARVQIWLKDTRLNAPSRLHPRIIGRFLKNLRTTFKLDTNNLTVLGLRTTPATKARLETMPQTPRTTPFTSLVIERVDTNTTRELLLAEVQLLATLGVATTNTFRIAQPTLWLESAAGIRWTQDTARVEFLTVFAPPRTTQTALTARVIPNPTTDFMELNYTLSRSSEKAVPVILLLSDMAGRTVKRVELGWRTTGEIHQETVFLSSLVAGTYRLMLLAPHETITGRVDILK